MVRTGSLRPLDDLQLFIPDCRLLVPSVIGCSGQHCTWDASDPPALDDEETSQVDNTITSDRGSQTMTSCNSSIVSTFSKYSSTGELKLLVLVKAL